MIATDGAARGTRHRRSWPSGIAGRVFIHTAAVVGAVLVAVLVIASYSGRRAAKATERRSLEQAADLTAQFLTARGRTLAGGARVFVQGPHFRALVAERHRDDILDQAFEAAEQLEADWVFITDERGVLLAKSDEPGVVGEPMGGIPLVAGALGGRETYGFGVSRDSLLFQTVAVPIIVPGAAPVGVLVATKLVDPQMALDVRAVTGADVIFYTLDGKGAPHVAPTSLARPSDAAAALPEVVTSPSSAGATTRSADPGVAPSARSARLGGTPYVLQGATLTTAGGDIVGGVVVARPESDTPAELAGMRRSVLAAAILGLVLALLAAWSSARRVTRPSRVLAAAAARALEGEYDDAARLAATASSGAPPNEIVTLGAALTTLLRELREKQSLGAAVGRTADVTDAETEESPLDGDDENERGTERRRSSRPRASGPRGRNAMTGVSRAVGTRWSARPTGSLPTGTLVADRYEIRDVRGIGGTGIVYRAIDRTLGETVAIKMLRPELVTDDPEAREELKRELRLTRRVSHRNIVRTYDFGSSNGVPFLTMEYVEGTALAAVIAHRGALPADAVLALAKQLLRALEAAHEQGITHGDLKPANLLVTPDGLLKVSDFGVASLVRRPRAARAAPGAVDGELEPPRLAGAVVGTPEYMAPELLVGGRPDIGTDLYAAGMVLHECLTGATPFQRDTPRSFLAQKLDGFTPPRTPTPASLERPPRSLEALIAWMTEPEPSARPGSAAEVGAVIARLA